MKSALTHVVVEGFQHVLAKPGAKWAHKSNENISLGVKKKCLRSHLSQEVISS